MKIIFFLTLSLAFYSCNQKNSKKDQDSPEFNKDHFITDNKEIIGNWTMCSTAADGNLIQYNVCPNVSFLNNGLGYVTNSSAFSERFSWTLKKGMLNILFVNNFPNSTFPDTLYDVIITKQNQLMNLEIIQSKKDKAYHLSKSI